MAAVRNGTPPPSPPPPPPALLTLEFPAALFVCGTGAGPTGDGSADDIASLHEIFRQFRPPRGRLATGLVVLVYVSREFPAFPSLVLLPFALPSSLCLSQCLRHFFILISFFRSPLIPYSFLSPILTHSYFHLHSSSL